MDAQPIQLHYVQKVDAVAVVDAPSEQIFRETVFVLDISPSQCVCNTRFVKMSLLSSKGIQYLYF